MNKLYVDDIRNPPDSTWDIARTSREAISMLKSKQYDLVSLDHDLGQLSREDMGALVKRITEEGYKPQNYDVMDTTRPIVLWWCENGGWPEEVQVHSANPVGYTWLKGMIERYKE